MTFRALPLVAAIAIALSSPIAPNDVYAAGDARPNQAWWPDQLDLQPLRQNAIDSNPIADFDYAAEFQQLDLAQLKSEISVLMTESQDWWPADYGHYGPFFIRMAWHSAGTYRSHDGRGGAGGGQQRFEPLNSWPDNANLDKARRLLWPIKQKYGQRISWADLMVLTGTVAMESMGFETFGFAGGREDDWEADLVYWGSETEMLGDDQRYSGDRKLEKPLAAVQMGLIYVNPEGPAGNHDPVSAAHDIRETFGRMGMNDEETVALIAGGHSFGKAHGAHKPADCVDHEPAARGVESQGIGWANKCGSGSGADTVTSGLEGAWTSSPAQWTHQYLQNLFAFEWKQTQSPAGATQWIPTDEAAASMVPDAHDPTRRHAPIMFTTDLALKEDPEYRKVSMNFKENPEEFERAFAKAWFKLTHRDMGPRARYLGIDVPSEPLIWQDPIPDVDHELINDRDVAKLKSEILDSGLSNAELVRTAWSSAASFRETDMRGGANGARLALEPQKSWEINQPEKLSSTLATLENIADEFNESQRGDKRISLADTIVLGGAAGIEDAARQAGHDITVPFRPGRNDASQEMTDIKTFALLEPTADGFRNYQSPEESRSPSRMLIERADALDLTVPEMTALIGGLRVIGANADESSHGVLTDEPGELSNDFFVNLLDMDTVWKPAGDNQFEGVDRRSGEPKWTATEVDLVFGSNSELRSYVEFYAYENAEHQFVSDFVDAWTKVMNLDRFDQSDDANQVAAN